MSYRLKIFPLFTPIEKTNVVAVLAFLLNLLLILKPFIPLSSPPLKITLSVSLLMGVACFLGSFTASSVVKFFEDFLSYVGFLSSLSPSFVICGDFNLHVDIMSPTVSEFKSVMDSCCLSQYIDFPTHLHGHTLDFVDGSI